MKHYREEVAQLAEWCGANNLSLNVSKTKEVVMNFRRNSVDHPPLNIDSSTVERVSSTKFLGVHITEDLTWTTNTMSISKKAQISAGWKEQVSLHPSSPLSTGEPLRACWPAASLSGTGTVVQQTARPSSGQWTQQQKPSVPLFPPSLFLARCSSKANSIVKDSTHPSHSLFQLLPSGRWYRSIRARSNRLLNSFFPQAVRDPPPPKLTSSQKKLSNFFVQFKVWACTNHL